MKNLKDYIVKEGLLDNMFYLLDTWFGNNKAEFDEFTSICAQCAGNKSTSTDKVKELLAGTSLEKNLQPFVNFIQGEVKMPENTNYLYLFAKIIDNVTANQKKDNRYIKKVEDVKPTLDNAEIVKDPKEKPLKDKEKQILQNPKEINPKVPQTNVKNKQGTTDVKTDSTYKVKSKKIVNNVEPIANDTIKSKAPQNLKQHGTTAVIDDNTFKKSDIKNPGIKAGIKSLKATIKESIEE